MINIVLEFCQNISDTMASASPLINGAKAPCPLLI